MLNRIEVLLGGAMTPVVCFDRNRYYIDALQLHSNSSLSFKPLSAQLFSTIRAMNLRGSFYLWSKWGELFQNAKLEEATNHIGRYYFKFDNGCVKVAIDSSDGRHLHDQQILDWSDIYFKCNYWPDVEYPDHVVPLVNGNGILSAPKIRQLKSYRNYPKKYDLVYWSRIWATPGQQENNLGVEHNIRLFERLAQVEGKTNLLAVFPDSLNTPELQSYRNRLDKAGVKWQNGWGNIDSKALWDSIASAKINFLRPGNHLCISWRMMDLLCMGACIMLDGAPYPRWPIPLIRDQNFVDVGCTLTQDYQLPRESDYESVVEHVTNLIGNPEKIQLISRNNTDYFDNHASMEAVARYITRSVVERFPSVESAVQTL